MGASQSQDSEPNVENNGIKPQNQEINNVQARGKTSDMEKTKKKQLPHNYKSILKDADSPVDMTSRKKLLSQLHHGVFLNQRRELYWVDEKSKKNCFMLFARDLSVIWGDERRYWRWSNEEETTRLSDKIEFSNIFVAELLLVWWLEVNGKIDLAKLSPETLYEVVFILKLKNGAHGLGSGPVKIRFTLPNIGTVEGVEDLMTKPRDQWLEIPVGDFVTSSENVGELGICINGTNTSTGKEGLVIKGVVIRAKK